MKLNTPYRKIPSQVKAMWRSSYRITNDPIFGLASEIDEDISTEDALDIDGDGGDSDVRGDEFELHTNKNETEYSI